MLAIISFILLFTIYRLYPKYVLGIFFLISCSLPVDHNETSGIFSLKYFGYNFLYTDIFLSIIILDRIVDQLLFREGANIFIIKNFKLKASIFLFLIAVFISVLIGFYSNFSANQIFYDTRPMLYFSIILFDFSQKKLKITLTNLTILLFVGFALYSILAISYLLLLDSHPFKIIFENSKLGRIVFHNEYLFLFIFPIIFIFINNKNISIKFRLLIFIFLLLFLSKLLVSMGRGMILFILISLIMFMVLNLKSYKPSIKQIYLFLKFIFIAPFFVLLFTNYILPFIWGEEYDTILTYYVSRFSNYEDSTFQDTHVNNRFEMWYTGFREFFISPIIGHGNGYYFSINSQEWDNKVSFVDSGMLTILIRLGLLGFIPFIFMMAIIIKSSFLRINAATGNILLRKLHESYFNGIVVFFIYSFFNSTIITSTAILPFLILVIYILKNEEI